jgi:hypothetical protein
MLCQESKQQSRVSTKKSSEKAKADSGHEANDRSFTISGPADRRTSGKYLGDNRLSTEQNREEKSSERVETGPPRHVSSKSDEKRLDRTVQR